MKKTGKNAKTFENDKIRGISFLKIFLGSRARMENERFQKDLTEGSVSRQLLRFSLPFLAAVALQAFYNVADMLIVGWFEGSVGISAVGIGGQITLLIVNLITGLAVGGTVLIAQYAGAKQYQDEKETVGTLFTIYGLAAVLLTAVLLFLVDPMLRMMSTPAESFAQARDYLNICVAGTVFIFGYNAVSAVLRGMGDSKNPLLFVAIATITNIVLDVLLVGPLHMGAAGAAVATIAAQALSLVLSIVYLSRRDFLFDFKPKSFRIHGDKAKLLLKIGLPSSVQNTLVSLSFVTLMTLVNGFGLDASAAFNIGGKVNSFAILPGIAMSQAIASMAGQNIGAGRPERALDTMKAGLRINILIALVICGAILAWPGPIMSMFNAGEATILAGTDFLRCLSGDAVISSIVFCFNGLFLGGGHTLVTLAVAFTTSILLRVPLAFLLANGAGLGLAGVGLAMTLAPLGGIAFGLIFLRSGRWKTRRIEVNAGAMLEG